MPERDEEVEERERAPERRRLSTWDTILLVLRTYWESLPYLLVMLGGLLLATWILTEVIF